MLVNLNILKIPDETVRKYQARLDDFYNHEGQERVVVKPEQYMVNNLPLELTGQKSAVGLYPVKISCSLGHADLLDEGVIVDEYPDFLPVEIVENIDLSDDGSYKKMKSRLPTYGICSNIPEFLALIKPEIDNCKRLFFIYFVNKKASANIWEKNGRLVKKDHSIPIDVNQTVYMYHICEVLTDGKVKIDRNQKTELRLRNLRGEHVNYECLEENF